MYFTTIAPSDTTLNIHSSSIFTKYLLWFVKESSILVLDTPSTGDRKGSAGCGG